MARVDLTLTFHLADPELLESTAKHYAAEVEAGRMSKEAALNNLEILALGMLRFREEK